MRKRFIYCYEHKKLEQMGVDWCGDNVGKVDTVVVDNFRPYFDKTLGCEISSYSQKRKVMKRQGVCYADDLKRNRDIGKEAEFMYGKHGDRKFGDKKWV